MIASRKCTSGRRACSGRRSAYDARTESRVAPQNIDTVGAGEGIPSVLFGVASVLLIYVLSTLAYAAPGGVEGYGNALGERTSGRTAGGTGGTDAVGGKGRLNFLYSEVQ
jgi:hypothetical protein